MKSLVVIPLLFSLPTLASINNEKKMELCSSSKEYITTVNYLMDKKEFSLKKEDALAVADEITKGCSGAAQQFIYTLDLLSKIEMTTSDAIKLAKKVAIADKNKAWAFRSILKNSFAPSKLDLPLSDAVKYALKLSIDFDGDAEVARNDFEELVEFCKDSDNLDLPVQSCAKMAFNMSSLTGKFHQSMSKQFIGLFNYLVDTDGPAVVTSTALGLSEELMQYGPSAEQNFIQAYKYGSNKKGLNLDRVKAIEFAKNLAKKSFREVDLK